VWALASFFSSLNYTQPVGLFGRIVSPSKGRYLHRTTQTQFKRTQTSMPRVGFEPTIPASERLTTVHALDRVCAFYLLTELSPSWEAANYAATEELPTILRNPKVHHRVHKSSQLVPILNQIYPVHTIPSHPIPSYLTYILILFIHLTLGLSSGLFPSGFPTNILYAFHVPLTVITN
jgi:hypothetical protein